MIEVLRIEREVLGSFLLDKGTHEYIHYLDEDDFIDESNKKVLASIKSLINQNKEVNYFELQEKTNLDITYIIDLAELVATTRYIESNIKLLKDKANRRRLIDKAKKIINMAKDNDVDIDIIKNDAMQEIDEIKNITNEEVITLREAMLDTITVLEKRSENKDDKSYHTGITKLDTATAGLHEEELTTIAARPGVGKTAIAMQIGLNIANNKRKVMFTSLEMSDIQLCQRIIAAYSKLDGNDLRRGNLNEDGWKKTISVAQRFCWDNFILDKTSKNTQHIRTKIRKYKPDLVIIDYLQLLKSVGKYSNREQEVSSITRDLKLMTLEFKIPIIMLSQLNRNAEGNRPTLADLRESGAIEQDSDNIIFIHKLNNREISELIEKEIYTRELIEEMNKRKNTLTDIILEKQRNGPTGTFGMAYIPSFMKFIPIDN
ncbi:replicative DNA helicase [Gottschalkia purinilytica]|uniref:DNA 5'-3' helicase n=1 Tax=Gottschalkia purinilytica TaxID=1503 RepID=A0A0L0WAQ8_GOTPU|nr:DnaB-like helicase C-terminal domain-containing protein [Gottschalkia purinilytica]KNF08532.1 replicative DNA helicase [Gottschalkia purinilytica]